MKLSAMVCRGLVASLFILITSSTYSAQQGSIGKTSTGSFGIRLVIKPNLQASIATPSISQTDDADSNAPNLNDATSTVATFNEVEPICIRGTGINQYSVVTEGSGAGGSYALRNDQRSYNYEVDLWPSNQEAQALNSGQNSNPINALSGNSDCDSSRTGFMVKLPQDVAQQPLKGELNLIINAE
ncbi:MULTISPECIES: hypothetical protein [unclassified Endozoicomonas]|uniref:hypothetical protein n=3 Tax=Endozoicomonas TaxID=305899 RepID=UPI0021494819|nr:MULTISPECIES: hypothetical protein [unclassified Endozoicomonas]